MTSITQLELPKVNVLPELTIPNTTAANKINRKNYVNSAAGVSGSVSGFSQSFIGKSQQQPQLQLQQQQQEQLQRQQLQWQLQLQLQQQQQEQLQRQQLQWQQQQQQQEQLQRQQLPLSSYGSRSASASAKLSQSLSPTLSRSMPSNRISSRSEIRHNSSLPMRANLSQSQSIDKSNIVLIRNWIKFAKRTLDDSEYIHKQEDPGNDQKTISLVFLKKNPNDIRKKISILFVYSENSKYYVSFGGYPHEMKLYENNIYAEWDNVAGGRTAAQSVNRIMFNFEKERLITFETVSTNGNQIIDESILVLDSEGYDFKPIATSRMSASLPSASSTQFSHLANVGSAVTSSLSASLPPNARRKLTAQKIETAINTDFYKRWCQHIIKTCNQNRTYLNTEPRVNSELVVLFQFTNSTKTLVTIYYDTSDRKNYIHFPDAAGQNKQGEIHIVRDTYHAIWSPVGRRDHSIDFTFNNVCDKILTYTYAKHIYNLTLTVDGYSFDPAGTEV